MAATLSVPSRSILYPSRHFLVFVSGWSGWGRWGCCLWCHREFWWFTFHFLFFFALLTQAPASASAADNAAALSKRHAVGGPSSDPKDSPASHSSSPSDSDVEQIAAAAAATASEGSGGVAPVALPTSGPGSVRGPTRVRRLREPLSAHAVSVLKQWLLSREDQAAGVSPQVLGGGD